MIRFIFFIILLLKINSIYADIAKSSLDPTQPSSPVTSETLGTGADGFKLEAIILSGNQFFAMINSTLVKKNTVINGYQVINIDQTSVKLNAQGKQDSFTLNLDPLQIKKPHAELKSTISTIKHH